MSCFFSLLIFVLLLRVRKIYLIVTIVLLSAINSFSQKKKILDYKHFTTLSHITIRALEARSDSSAWFGANHGVWGFTEDAGKHWHIDSLKVDSVFPEFRSIAVLNDSTVLLLSIASPAYLFKTTNKGKTWKLVYKNTDKNIFFDSMKFRDEKNGIAIGDPIDGCFQLITTNDAGETWKQINCSNIPKAMEEESLFASSNTCIDIYKNNVWFATGGKHARVFHSTDYGNHFESYETPITQGEKMTGIFSIAFADDTTGIITGGNYEKADSSIISIAVTQDGGKSWNRINNSQTLFGSCVQFQFFSHVCCITGHNGTFIANLESGRFRKWNDDESIPLNFHTLRFCPEKKGIWYAGDKGRVTFLPLK